MKIFHSTRYIAFASLLLFSFTSASHAQFKDVSEEFGFTGGGKASFADYNNDGFVDLHAGQLFKNEGGKKLVAQTEVDAPGGEVVWGDYDNDGYVDMLSLIHI